MINLRRWPGEGGDEFLPYNLDISLNRDNISDDIKDIMPGEPTIPPIQPVIF